MIWDERYRIGDGEKTTDETAPAVYRSYPECGITMTEELFNQIALRFKIYFATTDLHQRQCCRKVCQIITLLTYK